MDRMETKLNFRRLCRLTSGGKAVVLHCALSEPHYLVRSELLLLHVLKSCVGHAGTLVGAEVCDVLQRKNRNAGKVLCLYVNKVRALHVLKNEGRTLVLL